MFKFDDRIESKTNAVGITIYNAVGRILVACCCGELMVYKDHQFQTSTTDLLANLNQANLFSSIDHVKPAKNTLPETPKNTRTNKTKEAQRKTTKPASLANRKYHIVAGSFGKKSNAKRESERFKTLGYTATVVKSKNGNHLVSIVQSGQKAVVKEKLLSLKAEEENTWWIYKAD